MKFWDSSAVIPLLVSEDESARLCALLAEDQEIVVWWATPVECASALARREREDALALDAADAALARLRGLAAAWSEVQPTERLRGLAMRLLRVHDLRAADALQLAAALVVAGDVPTSLDFVCLDRRLGTATRREGLALVG